MSDFSDPTRRRKVSSALEKLAGKKYGLTPTKNSGAGKKKGDLQSDYFMVEQKNTSGTTYSFNYDTWQKLVRESNKEDKSPALMIGFGNGVEVFVISDHEFMDYKRFRDSGLK